MWCQSCVPCLVFSSPICLPLPSFSHGNYIHGFQVFPIYLYISPVFSHVLHSVLYVYPQCSMCFYLDLIKTVMNSESPLSPPPYQCCDMWWLSIPLNNSPSQLVKSVVVSYERQKPTPNVNS